MMTTSNKSFSEQIKVTTKCIDSEYEKKKFMQAIEENPKLLEQFSNKRLEKILQYYLEENEKKIAILKKLNT